MRLAFISETFLPATDGVVTRLLATLDSLERMGHNTLVLAPKGAPPSYAGAEVVSLSGPRLFLYPEKRINLLNRRAMRTLRAFQPELIHAINPVILGWSTLWAARKLGVPRVASYHTHIPQYAAKYMFNAMEPVAWSFMRGLHNRFDLNLATADATLEQLRERRFQKFKLWRKGVDTRKYRPEAATAAMRHRLSGGRSEKRVMLFAGRLGVEKDIDKLRSVVDTVPDAVLALVGDGPDRERLENVFEGAPVTFVGLLKGGELASAYAAADLFVFPSVTETLGLVVLEAMASGLPVVAYESPPTLELISEGETGHIIAPGDQTAFAERVGRLLDNPDRRADMAAAARSRSIRHNWDDATQQLLRDYRRLLESKQKGPAKRRPELSHTEAPS